MKVSKIGYTLLSALMLAGAVAPGVSTFAATSTNDETVSTKTPTKSVLSANITLNSTVTAAVSNPVEDTEIPLEQIFNELGLTEEERQAVIADILLHMFDSPESRARYYKTTTTYSAAACKKIVKEGNASRDAAVDAISEFGRGGKLAAATLKVLYALYDGRFATAANNGWGLKVTLTIDSYNPTSTGMAWSYSYIK